MTVDTTLGRAVGLYRRTATSRTAILLIVANAIPLIGVLFFGWSLLTILVIYWVENGIVGFWNVPRIMLAQGSAIPNLPELPDSAAAAATRSPEDAATLKSSWQAAREAQRQIATGTPGFGRVPGVGRVALAIFFLVHYGMFWLVHGIFVFALPAFGDGFASTICVDGTFPPGGPLPGVLSGVETCGGGAFGEVIWSSVAIAAAALFLSHGASFLFNYVGRGEYITASPTRQMAAPYGRVVVLHLTIIFGAFVVAILGSPIGALLVLVGLKTAFDLGLHLREHRNAGPPMPGPQRANATPAA